MNENKPPTRIRTGDFAEPFAYAANKRRKELQPIHLVPRLRSAFPSERGRRRSWFRGVRGQFADAESPEQHDGVHVRPMQSLLEIPVSCRRVPFGGHNPLLFLTTRDSDGARPSLRESGDIRWLQIQHSGMPFDEFINTAIKTSGVAPSTQSAMKEWLSALQSQLETSVFAGMTFPGVVKGSMFAAMDGDKQRRVKDSCLFFTLPYFLLSDRRFPAKDSQSHPIRALVQTLYRNESPFSRELRQAVNRMEHRGSSKVVYVPQMWCLLVNDNYIATCGPSQLHTRPTSYIATVSANEYPASVRLRLRWGLTFCIKLDECRTWFDFLLKVHHIYANVLRMHVDAEKCTYWRGESQIDVPQWTKIVREGNSPGALIDIHVLLPNENDGWDVPESSPRTIQQAYVDTSGLAVSSVKWDDVDRKSLEAFAVKWTINETLLDDEYQVEGVIPPALMDKITEHTKTRRALKDGIYHTLGRVSSSPLRRRESRSRRRVNRGGWDSPNQVVHGSDNDIYSFRNGIYYPKSPRPRRRVVHMLPMRDHDRDEECIWPGCYDSYKEPSPGDVLDDLFWIPTGNTQISSLLTGDSIPASAAAYLLWPLHPSLHQKGTPQRSRPVNTRETRRISRRQASFSSAGPTRHAARGCDDEGDDDVVIDDSPISHLDRILAVSQPLYRQQEPKSKFDLDSLLEKSDAAASTEHLLFARTLAVDASNLIDHFLRGSLTCTIAQKAFGALYEILEKCEKLDSEAPQPWTIGVDRLGGISSEMEKALGISEDIREGMDGYEGGVFLLQALVDAFTLLVLGLIQLNDELSARYHGDRIDQRDQRDRRDRRGGRETDTRNRTSRAISSQSPSPSPETHIPISRPRRRTSNTIPFQQMSQTLNKAKTDILQLLESQRPLNLTDYSTVNPSGILASIITSLVHGDCDLPLPLRQENAHLSSFFSTIACGDANSVIQLDLGGIYQEYCSKLRLLVREHPTRNLLDDLDLTDEELDSLIRTSETQKRVVLDFQTQSAQRQPTQNAWVAELDSVARMLDSKIDVYRDLKVQINRLRRQVTLQIELKQDNNSKAIFVFTIVTVIFLPLSFMTSYFGMNTPDLRDMETGQWLFWAISVPLTVIVVGFCMVLAYQGRRIQGYLVGLFR